MLDDALQKLRPQRPGIEDLYFAGFASYAAEDVFRTLATENRRDRAHNPGLAPDRVDTIVAGALILVTVMRHWKHDLCLVSEADSLDASARSMLR